MTWPHLVARVAKRNRLPKNHTDALLRDAFALILAEVRRTNGRLAVPGFGVFYAKASKARLIQNIWTDLPLQLPASHRIGLRAAGANKW